LLKNRCVSCAQVISAPEALRGTRVFCPACGAENQLRESATPSGRTLGAALPAVLPSSRLAAERLEDASTVLLAFAYLTGLLALATGAVPVSLGSWPIEWRLLSLLGGALASAVLFVSLKYASEAMRALADVARAATTMEARLERLSAALDPSRSADDTPRQDPRSASEPTQDREPAP
jgi:hypothetical protein